MTVKIIAAMDSNGLIGNSKTNSLPWPKISLDMTRFKRLTMGHTVVMERKTFEGDVYFPDFDKSEFDWKQGHIYLDDGILCKYNIANRVKQGL